MSASILFSQHPIAPERSGGSCLFRTVSVFAALVLAAPWSTWAADGGGSAQEVYRQERARCMQAPPDSDRAACLKSAGAALQASRSGQLDVASHPYAANALMRCDPLPPADREDCILRMHGEGTVSGSVPQGGILRELTTETPARAAPSRP